MKVQCHVKTALHSVSKFLLKTDSFADVVNVYEMLETGELPKASVSVFATQQFIAGFPDFMSEATVLWPFPGFIFRALGFI